MKLNKLTTFKYNIPYKGKFESSILHEIQVNKLESFYLDDFVKTNTKVEKVNLINARNYLLKMGMIISIIDTDVELNKYSYKFNHHALGFEGNIITKGKIINITYQDLKKRATKYFDNFPDRDISEENFKLQWVKNYNEWLINYYNKNLLNRI